MNEGTDLGVSPKEMYGGMGMPATMSSPEGKEPEKIYPTFRYEGPEDLDLPQEGEMTIHFFKKSETSKVDPATGKHWYECCIEVRCMCDVEGEEEDDGNPPTRRDNSTEAALDKIARTVMEARGSGNSGY